MIFNSTTINMVLNFAGVLLGGGALAAWLGFISRMRGLHNQDEADIRDHYAQEVAALREANMRLETHFRDMITKIEARHDEALNLAEKRWRLAQQNHDECIAERTELRNDIRGLETKIREYSTNRLLVLEENCPPSESAPHALAAAKRLKEQENGDK